MKWVMNWLIWAEETIFVYYNPDGFDKNIKFEIMEVVNRVDIDVKDCKWMHNLNSFQPVGINIEYPFGLPLLGQN